MSTKFYIKDENGIYLSVDGKTRYSMLEGDELYLFLMSEEASGFVDGVVIPIDGGYAAYSGV